MNAEHWKQLQWFLYLFYGLPYLYICFTYTGGLRRGESEYLV